MARWRVRQDHEHSWGGRQLRAGDEFEAPEERLVAMQDKVERVGPADSDTPPKAPEARLVLRRAPGRAGWWNVVNQATGEPINARKLREAEARALIGDEGGEADGDDDA